MEMKNRKTFSVFTKVLIVLFLAFIVYLIVAPPFYAVFAHRRMRADLESWAATINPYDPRDRSFCLHGAELQDPNNPFAETIGFWVQTYGPDPVDEQMEGPSRFYVLPPGKWVNSIDEVISTWDEQYRLHMKNGLAPVRRY